RRWPFPHSKGKSHTHGNFLTTPDYLRAKSLPDTDHGSIARATHAGLPQPWPCRRDIALPPRFGPACYGSRLQATSLRVSAERRRLRRSPASYYSVFASRYHPTESRTSRLRPRRPTIPAPSWLTPV